MTGGVDAASQAFRAEQRFLRNAGFVACLFGVLALIAGRFMPGAPVWGVYVGVGIIALGWGLFAWSMLRRAAYARAHPSARNG